jgi:FMN-dependent NADH-azoreductase
MYQAWTKIQFSLKLGKTKLFLTDPFLRDIMRFIGVEDYKSLIVEGHAAYLTRLKTLLKKCMPKFQM